MSGAAAEVGTEVHLGPGREAGFASPSGGEKEGEGESALGPGTETGTPGAPRGRYSPQPREPPATSRRGQRVDAFGDSSCGHDFPWCDFCLFVRALGGEERGNWVTGKTGHFS